MPYFIAVVPDLFGTRNQFHGRQFSPGLPGGWFQDDSSALGLLCPLFLKGFPGAQMVKNLPGRQATRVRSLGQEDPLEKEMATHSGILAWRIPWTQEPGGLQSMGQQSQTQLSDSHFPFTHFQPNAAPDLTGDTSPWPRGWGPLH